MLYGRRDIPGDSGLHNVFDHRNVLNRSVRAQIVNVDAKNGVVVIDYENIPSGGKYITVAPLWMSFPDAKVGNPAWGRFIPHEGDLVRVSFDYDDQPVIIGYDIIASLPDEADGFAGWPALNKQYEDAIGGNDDKAKFAKFIPLKSGEYDFMSSGGAYIYGRDEGTLYMAGGRISVLLSKEDVNLISFAIGDVLDADNNEVKSDLTDESVRFWYQSFDDNKNEVIQMSMDKSGNWDVKSTGTVGARFDFQSGNITTKSKEVTFTASTKLVVDSPSIKLGSDSAAEAAVLGNAQKTAFDTYMTTLHNAIIQAFTTGGMSPTGPVVFPTALPALILSVNNAKIAYDTASNTFLSNTVKVK
jgi:hypothetical protein